MIEIELCNLIAIGHIAIRVERDKRRLRMATQADYDVGTAAALVLIRHEVEVLPIPGRAATTN